MLEGVSSSFPDTLCAHRACQMKMLKGIPNKIIPYITLKHHENMVKSQLELFFWHFALTQSVMLQYLRCDR